MQARNLIILAALAVGGCASIDLEAERTRVIDDATSRTGMVIDPAAAELETPLTRDAAVRYALENNLDYRADLAEMGLARARLVEASRPANPVLDILWFPTDGAKDFVEFELSVALIDALATPWRADAARNAYEAAQRNATRRTLDFMSEVETQWITAVAARQRLELQTGIHRAAEASLLVSEELFEAGNIPPVERNRERVFAQTVELDLINAELRADQAARQLALIMGMQTLPADTLPARLDHPVALARWPERAVLEASSLAIEERRLLAEARAREAGIENIESLFPHSELGVVFEREHGDWENGLALETALPIFDFGRSRRAAAEISAIRAAERYQAERQRLAMLSAYHEAEWQTALNQADFLRETHLPSVDALMSSTMRQYNAMQLDVFDLIATYQSTAQAGVDYVNAVERAHRAALAARLMQAGGLPAMTQSGPVDSSAIQIAEGGH